MNTKNLSQNLMLILHFKSSHITHQNYIHSIYIIINISDGNIISLLHLYCPIPIFIYPIQTSDDKNKYAIIKINFPTNKSIMVTKYLR